MVMESVKLTKSQVGFLMSKFGTDDPDEAIDLFIEFLIKSDEGNLSPSDLVTHLMKIMARENN